MHDYDCCEHHSLGHHHHHPFHYWCHHVLPLVYDDSLSYYELLCKVVHYLNNTINDLQEVATSLQELKDWIDGEGIEDKVEEIIDKYVEEHNFVFTINGKTGDVELGAADVGAIPDEPGAVTGEHLAEGSVTPDKVGNLGPENAGKHLAVGDDGELTFVDEEHPVLSVNGKTGHVVLETGDVLPAGNESGDVLIWDEDTQEWIPSKIDGDNMEDGAIPLSKIENQGSAQAGKILKVGGDGAIVLGTGGGGADLPPGENDGDMLYWDEDTQEWLPGPGVTGAVTSVNGKTGDVVLNASDVNALPDEPIGLDQIENQGADNKDMHLVVGPDGSIILKPEDEGQTAQRVAFGSIGPFVADTSRAYHATIHHTFDLQSTRPAGLYLVAVYGEYDEDEDPVLAVPAGCSVYCEIKVGSSAGTGSATLGMVSFSQDGGSSPYHTVHERLLGTVMLYANYTLSQIEFSGEALFSGTLPTGRKVTDYLDPSYQVRIFRVLEYPVGGPGTASGVTSVNNKFGDVVLTAEDVGAIPLPTAPTSPYPLHYDTTNHEWVAGQLQGATIMDHTVQLAKLASQGADNAGKVVGVGDNGYLALLDGINGGPVVNWENKSVASVTTGGLVDSDIRLFTMLPDKVDTIECYPGVGIRVFAYTEAGVYAGQWKGAAFSTASGSYWMYNSVPISLIQLNYPQYKLGVVIGYTKEERSVSPSDADNMVGISYERGAYLETDVAALNKILGPADTELLWFTNQTTRTIKGVQVSMEDGNILRLNGTASGAFTIGLCGVPDDSAAVLRFLEPGTYIVTRSGISGTGSANPTVRTASGGTSSQVTTAQPFTVNERVSLYVNVASGATYSDRAYKFSLRQVDPPYDAHVSAVDTFARKSLATAVIATDPVETVRFLRILRRGRMEFMAHKGDKYNAPVNSKLAYELACRKGIEWLNIAQCRQSADGTWWCLHDDDLSKCTTGTGSIAAASDSYIRSLMIKEVWTYHTYTGLDDFTADERALITVEDVIKLSVRYGNRIMFRFGSLPDNANDGANKEAWDSFIELLRKYSIEKSCAFSPDGGTDPRIAVLMSYLPGSAIAPYYGEGDSDELNDAHIDAIIRHKQTYASLWTGDVYLNTGNAPTWSAANTQRLHMAGIKASVGDSFATTTRVNELAAMGVDVAVCQMNTYVT